MKKPPSPARRIRDLAALGLDTPENRTLRLNRTIHNRIHRTHP